MSLVAIVPGALVDPASVSAVWINHARDEVCVRVDGETLCFRPDAVVGMPKRDVLDRFAVAICQVLGYEGAPIA